MLYLLWALLNTGLFIFICFKGSRYFRQKFGHIAAVVFVLGLLALMAEANSDKDNKEPNSNRIKTWKFNSLDSLDKNSQVFIDIDLERSLISKYYLGIAYCKDKQLQNNIPVSADTFITGITTGTSWKPGTVMINRTDDNRKFEYEVYGTIKWSLLGITIYHQPKHWQGVVVLK
jgi:hypothetical protein